MLFLTGLPASAVRAEQLCLVGFASAGVVVAELLFCDVCFVREAGSATHGLIVVVVDPWLHPMTNIVILRLCRR